MSTMAMGDWSIESPRAWSLKNKAPPAMKISVATKLAANNQAFLARRFLRSPLSKLP